MCLSSAFWNQARPDPQPGWEPALAALKTERENLVLSLVVLSEHLPPQPTYEVTGFE